MATEYEVEGHVYRRMVVKADSPAAAAAAFRKRHGSRPETVGEMYVTGSCEVCGAVLFDGDAYDEDENGVAVHRDEAACRNQSKEVAMKNEG